MERRAVVLRRDVRAGCFKAVPFRSRAVSQPNNSRAWCADSFFTFLTASSTVLMLDTLAGKLFCSKPVCVRRNSQLRLHLLKKTRQRLEGGSQACVPTGMRNPELQTNHPGGRSVAKTAHLASPKHRSTETPIHRPSPPVSFPALSASIREIRAIRGQNSAFQLSRIRQRCAPHFSL
jgi:hypothetical protein